MDTSYLRSLWGRVDPMDYVEAEQAALADHVATYFMSRRLKYLDVAGIGRHGGALVFREHDRNNIPRRKIIIKYSLSEEADEDLQNEARCLELLRGAEHIVQIIPLAGANLDISGTGRRPTLALEFLSHGTAGSFLHRLNAYGVRIPNRLLWRILLCCARQLTAMAYPPQGGPNAPVVSERINPNVAPVGLTQNSCHLNNLVIGDLTPGSAEHGLAPIFKLIDFGRGRMTDAMGGYEANLFGAGCMILTLAAPDIPAQDLVADWQSIWNEYELQVHPNAPEIVMTCAHRAFLDRQDLDPLLQDLVARMLSHFRDDKPDLAELVQTCEDAVANRRVEDFDNNNRLSREAKEMESDYWIRELVRVIILDADVAGGPLEHERPIQDTQMGTSLQGGLAATMGQTLLPGVGRRPPARQTERQTLYEGFNRQVNRTRGSRGSQSPTLYERFIRFINGMRNTLPGDVD
ncbi:hypothetical protein F5Y06DRAFT_73330 [Hypoxylon sp. FL0890]|nr:hypothetical protein F5Y06DRAFT_73330 [Hypoxylon sp. FL0890]